ncbi:hypothetical protein [Enterococcus sp. HY326]|nr:hypothetical protein [Enterococcus sp. HY326]
MEIIFSVLSLVVLSGLSLFGLVLYTNQESQRQKVPVRIKKDER